jgi:hypothetical protein
VEAGGQDLAAELIPRITRRCLTDDLGFPANSVDRAIEELADESEVVAAFRERRAAQGYLGRSRFDLSFQKSWRSPFT